MALRHLLSYVWSGKSAPAGYTQGYGPSWQYPFADAFNKQRVPTPQELVREAVNTAYACMTLNANLIAATPLRLYVTTGRGQSQPKMSRRGETRAIGKSTLARLRKGTTTSNRVAKAQQVEEVLDHPLLDLLNNPNPDEADGTGMSIHQLFDFTQLYQECVGRAYWMVDDEGLGGTPRSIWILAAQSVREVCTPNTDRIIDYYEFGGGNGQRFDPSLVVPFRMPDLHNPYIGGMSPLRGVIEKVRLGRKVDASTNAILDNGGMPSAVWSPKGDSEGGGVGTAEAERMRFRFKQMFNMAGRGGVMVSESPGTFEPIQIPPRDMFEMELLKVTKVDVANGYQVPITLLEPNDSNLTGVKFAAYAHGRYAGQPRCSRNEAVLNRFLVPRYDPTGRLFVAYDSPVPEDQEEAREDEKVLISARSIRINELRQRHGLEDVEGGDAMVQPVKGGFGSGDGDKGEGDKGGKN